MVSGKSEGTKETIQSQTDELVKECWQLLSYLRSYTTGDTPDVKTGADHSALPNPIDNAIEQIHEARKVIWETRALLADAIISKL